MESKLKESGIKRQQFLERVIDDFLDLNHTKARHEILNDDDFVLQLATKVKRSLKQKD